MNARKTSPRKSRGRLKIVGVATALALVTLAAWWAAGRKVWIDDHGLTIADSQARLREVLWSPPAPLEGLFPADQQQYEPSFSPDGTELYFVAGRPGHNADIYSSLRRNNAWSTPKPLTAVNTKYDELGPRVTADGKFLLFYSDRPGGMGGYDIWAAPRSGDGWGRPFNLGPSVNSAFNEFTPDPTPDGKHLIFATNRTAAGREQAQPWRATIRENEASDFDLWMAELKAPDAPAADAIASDSPPTQLSSNGSSQPPATQPSANVNAPSDSRTTRPDADAVASTPPATQPIDAVASTVPSTQPTDAVATTAPSTEPAIAQQAAPPAMAFAPAQEIPGLNTPFVEGASCMSPAGDFLYFASNRPGGLGKFDIWRCRVSADFKFGPAENAGPSINSPDDETDPALAFNGYRLIFSSDRGSDAGVYRLFSSDSREVYATRQGRPLPHPGNSFYLLLASLLVLLPLLLMLRNWDSGSLGVLQKCLLISLLAHVLACLAMSFLWVSQDVYHYARTEMGIEAAISLNPSSELEVGTSIRRESTSGDLPTAGAAPRAERVIDTALETRLAVASVDAALPRAQAVAADALAAPTAAPAPAPTIAPADPSTPAPRAVAPTLDTPPDAAVDPRLRAPAAVSAVDLKPQVESALASRSTRETAQIDNIPRSVEAAPAPVAKMTASSTTLDPAALNAAPAAHVLTANPQTPTPAAPMLDRPAGDAPRVDVAQTAAARLTSTDAAPTAGVAPPSLAAPRADASMARPNGVASRDVASAVGPVRASAAPVGPSLADATPPSAPRPVSIASDTPSPAAEAPGLISAPDAEAPRAPRDAIRVGGSASAAPAGEESRVASSRQPGALAADALPKPDATGAGASLPAVSTKSTTIASTAMSEPSVVKAVIPGPTTAPAAAGVALAVGPDPSLAALPAPAVREGKIGEDRALPATGAGAASATGPLASSAVGSTVAMRSVAAAPLANTAPPLASGPSSLAPKSLAPMVVPTAVAAPSVAPSAPLPQIADGPAIAVPRPAPAMTSPRPADGGTPSAKPAAPDASALASRQTLHGPEGGGGRNTPLDIPGPTVSVAALPKEAGSGFDSLSVRPLGAPMPMPTSAFEPKIDIGPLPTDIGAGKLNAPDSPFKLRSPEMHRPIIEKLGGNEKSEDAVDRALFWLADNQADDGRWTVVTDDHRRKRDRSVHDTALTGLALLAYFAQDHRPDKPGPYQQTVARGMESLLSSQRADGDLRGDSPGAGAAQSNMYDHGIASYAMAEAAALTHDPRYTAAALRAADFIVNAQNPQTGGWRYAPRESADTSVFGWQVMALHSAERVGFVIPKRTREGIDRYIASAVTGERHMLASYLPNAGPTPTMTAQMAFSRMLLGQQFDAGQMREASDFLSRTPPESGKPDMYYWYYASLCLSQMNTPDWKHWNEQTRDALVGLQHRDGEHGGYWDANVRKGESAGRVFSTALGALTLEVYYRYMPMQQHAAPGEK